MARVTDFRVDRVEISEADYWNNRVAQETARMNTGTLAGMAKKRGYSREFTPRTERRVRFEIDRIPPTLYDAVTAKAKRDGISLRALTLTLWKLWSDGEVAIERIRTEG